MPLHDDDSIVVLPKSGPSLAHVQPSIEDAWDAALTGVISEHSRRAYKNALVHFAGYLLERAGVEPPADGLERMQLATPLLPQVQFNLVAEYRDDLRGQSFAHRTINVRLAALNALFKRMMRLKLIESNPASPELVQRLKVSAKSDTEGLSNEEAEKILRLCFEDKSLKGKRDLALFAVLMYNGLRRSEVVQLDIGKVRFIKEIPTTSIRAKGDKWLAIEFVPPVWAAIDKWLVAADIKSGPIFRSVKKRADQPYEVGENRLTPDGVYDIIRSRTRKAGIEKNIHPHSLRHTYATLALLAGVPIQDVQVSMGHSSTDTTFRYYRAIEQVGRSPGRSIQLNWPEGPDEGETP